MTVAASLLRQARLGRGLTQARLAALARRPQPEVGRIESSGAGANVVTLDRLVRSAGLRLAVLPTDRAPVAEHAVEVREFLRRGDTRSAWREVVQLADDLAAEHGAERVALAVTPAAATGDARFDALIAGVVELRLVEEGLPLPRWLAGSFEALDEPWVVAPHVSADEVRDETPEPLRRRNVLVHGADLVSV